MVTATETGSQSSEPTTAVTLLGHCAGTNLDIQVNEINYKFIETNRGGMRKLVAS